MNNTVYNSVKRKICYLTIFIALGLFLLPSLASAQLGRRYNVTQNKNITSTGQSFTFTFSNIPQAVTDVGVTVSILGDYGSINDNKTAGIAIDGKSKGSMSGGPASCNTTTQVGLTTKSFIVSPKEILDGKLIVVIKNSSTVRAICGTKLVKVNVTYATPYPEPELTFTVFQRIGTYTFTQGQSSNKVKVQYEFRNVGKDAGPFKVRFYISKDQTITTSDTYAGKEISVPSLKSGLFYPSPTTLGSVDISIPASLPAGNYFVGAVLDYNNKVKEYIESNNGSHSIWDGKGRPGSNATYCNNTYRPYLMRCKYSFEIVKDLFDLYSGYNGTSTIYTTYESPDPVGVNKYITICARVYNTSTTKTITGLKVLFYVSKDSTVNSSDRNAGVGTLLGSIGPRRNASVCTKWLVPANEPEGRLYTKGIIDYDKKFAETNENNNETRVGSFLVASKPDLNSYFNSLSPSSRKQRRGQPLSFTPRIRNLGVGDAKNFKYRIVWSTNYAVDSGDTLIKEETIALLKGKQYSSRPRITFNVPNGIATEKTYYVCAYIDWGKTVPETNENNNQNCYSVYVTDKPDFYFTYFTVDPESAKPNGRITITYELYNNGTVSGTYNVRLYYSADSSVTTSDTVLANIIITNHRPGTRTTRGVYIVKLPANAQLGYRWLGGIADWDKKVPEGSETNNTRTARILVSDKPELRATYLRTNVSSIVAGKTLTVTFRTQNFGVQDVRNAKIRFYLSKDAVIDPATDIYMGKEYTVATWLQGAYYPATGNGTFTYTIPANTTGGYKYIGIYVDYNKKFAENDEKDNILSYRVLVYANEPDMYFYYFSPRYSGILGAGSKITMSFRVRNIGKKNAGSFVTRFYLSSDSNITSADTSLGDYTISSLNVNQITGYLTKVITLPANAGTGRKYIGGWIDYNLKVKESNENNNKRAYAVNLYDTRPELYHANFYVRYSGALLPGSRVTASIRIRNAGRTTAATSKLRFYISRDATISTADTRLADKVIPALASYKYYPASTYLVTVLTLPTNLTAGRYYIGSYVDWDKKIGEVNETNNTIAYAITVQSSKPDLIPNYLRPSTATLYQGGTVRMSYRFYNNGYSTASNFRVRFYMSVDSTITPSDTYLGTEVTVSSLASKKPYPASTYGYVNVTIPANYSTGRRYIGYYIDYNNGVSETSETNNARSYAVTVNAGTRDLYFTYLSRNTSSVVQGGSLTITHRIYNNGTLPATNFKMRFYLSTDNKITTADTYLGKEVSVSSLGANKYYPTSSNGTITVTIPSGLAPRRYYLGGIVDTTNSVKERSEINNTRAYYYVDVRSSLPDLQITYFAPSTSTIAQGARITARYRIRNTGPNVAKNFKLRFFLSTDTNITTADTYLNVESSVTTVSGGAYYPGSRTTVTVVGTVPVNYPVGKRYLGAIVDYAKKVKESNENNNTKAYPVTIVKGYPDMYFSYYLARPSSAAQGGKITIFYRVYNRGTIKAGTFKIRFMLSDDTTINTSDVYLNKEITVSSLDPAKFYPSSANGSVVITIPNSTKTGTKYLGGIIDHTNVVRESNERNNTRYARISVGSGKPDFAMKSFSVSPTSSMGHPSRIGIRLQVTNQGAATSSRFNVSVYYGDKTATSGLTRIGIYSINGLGSGSSSITSLNVALPPNVLFGTHYIHYFIDSSAAVAETNENNNRGYTKVSITGRPDYTPTTFVPSAATVFQGGSLKLNFRVQNIGASRTTVATRIRFYLSTDSTITTSDKYLGYTATTPTTVNSKAYAPSSGNGVVTVTIPVPANQPTKTYYLGIIVDYDKKLIESNERNNTRSYKISVVNKNDPPKFTSKPPTPATEDKTYTYNPTVVDPDPGDTKKCSIVKAPAGAKIDPNTCKFTWTPSDKDSGKTYDIEIKVCDKAGACSTQKWKLPVTGVNDPPKITTTPPTNATENKSYAYSPKATDADLPNDTLTWKLSKAPAGAKIDPKTGKITWTPGDKDASKTFDFEVTVCDKAGVCDKQSWKVSVQNTNDPPKITKEPGKTADEDQVYTYDPKAVDPDPNDRLTHKLIKGPKGAKIDPKTGKITWTPGDDDVKKGTVSFEYEVCDRQNACDKRVWTVKVNNKNDPPKIVSKPTLGATQNTPYNYTVKAEDPDPNDTITYKLKSGPNGATINAQTGKINWTPNNSDVIAGERSFEVEACDAQGKCDTQTWKVKITNKNDPPTLTGTPDTKATEDKPYTFKPKASDPDPDDKGKLVFSIDKAPKGAKIDPKTGEVTWTPSDEDVKKGTVEFSIKVCDPQGACATKTWKVKVSNVNDSPTITSTPTVGATEGKPYKYTVTATDPDPGDQAKLKYSLKNAPPGAKINPKTGEIDWKPGPDDVKAGEREFVVEVCDPQGACTRQKFKVKVSNVNDPPKITSKPPVNATEEKEYAYTPVVVDPDPGDSYTCKLNKAPQGAKMDPKTCKITWTPPKKDVGKTFEYEIEVCDKSGECVKQTWKVTVGNVNDAPKITSKAPEDATVGNQLTYQPTVEDPDKGDKHTWKLKKGPSKAKVDPSTGEFTWTPEPGEAGKDIEIEIEVCDDGNPIKCATQKFKIKPHTRCKVDSDCKTSNICITTKKGRICVPAGCGTKSPKCAAKGQFCKDGTCTIDLCSKKQCAKGSTCRPSDGKCINSCAGVQCASGTICDGGTCLPTSCKDNPCKASEVCDDSNPKKPVCIKDPCNSKSCKHGRVCWVGRCVDDPCGSMTCPDAKDRCYAGQCVERKKCAVDVDCGGQEICENNLCYPEGCYTSKSCQTGQLCLKAECKTNGCIGSSAPSCNKKQFCRPGLDKCVGVCAGIKCSKGKKCEDGACVSDPCDGKTCSSGEICIAGQCVTDNCSSQNRCKHGRICSKPGNKCVDDPCANIKCPDAKQVCSNGQCQSPPACTFDADCPQGELCVKGKCEVSSCKASTDCASGEVCQDGKCITDPCDSITCKSGTFCFNGQCINTCAGIYCSQGEICTTGKCVVDVCGSVSCKTGTRCINGTCVNDPCKKDSCRQGRLCTTKDCADDSCNHVTCPKGQVCKKGQCTGDRTCKVDIECPGDGVCIEGSCKPSDCYKNACKSGKICLKGQCIDNPCDNKSCGSDEFCHPVQDKCIKLCPKCKSGELCKNGACETDPCASISCQKDEVCKEGTCISNGCYKEDGSNLCRYQRVCQKEKPSTCKDTSCLGVKCPSGYSCNKGQCSADKMPEEEAGEEVTPEEGPAEKEAVAEEAAAEEAPTEAIDAGEPTIDNGPIDSGKKDSGAKEEVETVKETSAEVVTDQGYDQILSVGGGCGCTATSGSNRGPFFIFLSILFLLVPFFRRRK